MTFRAQKVTCTTDLTHHIPIRWRKVIFALSTTQSGVFLSVWQTLEGMSRKCGANHRAELFVKS